MKESITLAEWKGAAVDYRNATEKCKEANMFATARLYRRKYLFAKGFVNYLEGKMRKE